MTDCLLVGFFDPDFNEYVSLLHGMGASDGAYRDLDLAFVRSDGRAERALDTLTRLAPIDPRGDRRPYHNADFLWPTILYLGTYLRRAGLTFDYVNLPHFAWDRFQAKLAERPLTVAITTTLYVSPLPIIQLVKFVRQHAPEACVVVGGPFIANHARLDSQADLDSLFEYIGADLYIINQEGEHTLVEFLRALKSGQPVDQLPNLGYRRDFHERFGLKASSTVSPAQEGIRTLTDLLLSVREGTPLNQLATLVGREDGAFRFTPQQAESNPLEDNIVNYRWFPTEDLGEFVSLRTARSCPFACAFCGFPARAGKYRFLPVDLVERELDELAELGVTTLTFLDDTFNVPRRRFKALLHMMIAKDYKFRWNSFYRCDQGDEEVIELMAASGCEGVFLGVESGSDVMLEAMNKTARRAHYMSAIPALKRAGIVTHANLIIGFPGETPETVRETEQFLDQAAPDFFRAQLWYADPTTPVWQRREELGIKGSGFKWSHHTMDAQTASGYVERLFLSVDRSTWLPQNGFELWSVYYLRRRGFTLQQIHGFLQGFNTGVKEKLLGQGHTELSAPLQASMRMVCRPDHEPGGEPPQPVERLSARRYRDAERWWYSQLDRPGPGDPGGALQENGRERRLSWTQAVEVQVEQERVGVGPPESGLGLADLVVAAFTDTLAAAAQTADIIVLAGRVTEQAAIFGPLRRNPADGRLLGRATAVAGHWPLAQRHAPFAHRLLSGWIHREGGAEGAVGCAGWVVWYDEGSHADGTLAERLRQAVGERFGLGLEVINGDPLVFRWWHTTAVSSAAVHRLQQDLLSLLRPPSSTFASSAG